MADDSERYSDIVSRRRFVELTGISGVAALAGCLGGDGGGTDTPTEGGETSVEEGGSGATSMAGEETDTTSGGEETGMTSAGAETDTTAAEEETDMTAAGETGEETTAGDGTETAGGGTPMEVMDAQHLTYINTEPGNIQWNAYNPSSYAQITDEVLFDHFAKYNFARSEFTPYGIADWTVDGDTMDLTVRDGLTWSNGDNVTAADVALQLRLGLQTEQPYSDYTESIEEVDDSTVRLSFSGEINQQIAEFQILANNWIQTPESVFGEYLEEGTSTGTASGGSGLLEFAWQDPIASGPWELGNVGNQQLTATRREDHPDAGNINFSEYVGRFLDGNQAAQQALINGEIDSTFSLFSLPRIVDDYPDAIQQVLTPSLWGFGLIPNHDHQHAGDRAVRQAIQHVINRQQVAANISTDSKQAPPYAMGIASDFQEQWLGDQADSFRTYGADTSQADQATQVLEDAGYTMSGGNWQDGDGNTVSLPLLVPSGWGDWNTAAQTVVDQLNNFGFEAVLDGRQFSTLSSSVWGNGDFVLAAGGWLAGAPQGAYPYFSLRHQLVENFRGFTYNYGPANDTRGGSNAEVTVPSRTGDGETTVNPSERLAELSTATDDATINEITLEQAWITNVDLPMIPVIEKQEQTFITGGDEWSIPEEGAEVSQVRWANTWLPRQGEMTYTGGN